MQLNTPHLLWIWNCKFEMSRYPLLCPAPSPIPVHWPLLGFSLALPSGIYLVLFIFPRNRTWDVSTQFLPETQFIQAGCLLLNPWVLAHTRYWCRACTMKRPLETYKGAKEKGDSPFNLHLPFMTPLKCHWSVMASLLIPLWDHLSLFSSLAIFIDMTCLSIFKN